MSPYVVEKRDAGGSDRDRDRRLRALPWAKRTWPGTSRPAG
jgi:hypothetical protein